MIHTVECYWDCECERDFIHPSYEAVCQHCNAERDSQPDSRADEALEAYIFDAGNEYADRAYRIYRIRPVYGVVYRDGTALLMAEHADTEPLMTLITPSWACDTARKVAWEELPERIRDYADMRQRDFYDAVEQFGSK